MTYSPELWTVTSLSTQAEVTAWSDGRFKVLSRPDDFLAAVRHALAYRTWGSLSIWSARFLSAILIHVAFDPTHGPGAARNLVEVLMTTRPPDRLADMIDRGLGMFAPRDHPVGLIGTLAMIDYLERTGDTKGVLPVTFRMDGAIQYPLTKWSANPEAT